jgi:hypothetical protein
VILAIQKSEKSTPEPALIAITVMKTCREWKCEWIAVYVALPC